MISIAFTKAHGSENDFLLTWRDEAPNENLPEIARRICARTTGIGADGWMLVWQGTGGLHTRLFNSDGTEPEISGNGTRCAAAFAVLNGSSAAPELVITTGAGPKTLRLISRTANGFIFEMDMGIPAVDELRTIIHLAGTDYDATILNVGNPQCAIFVPDLPENWRSIAAEAERHPRFSHHSNVSFVTVKDRHTISAVFYERGAGETRSSGTGSTGAGAAAILRGESDSPLEIRGPAGALHLRWDESIFLTGPAEIIAEGRFFLDL